MNTEEVIEIHDFQKGYLTLPFDETQFKDFITGLLGKPQTITKRMKGTFEIHIKDLQNFHDLLNQRIIQQNGGKLVQLATNIYYSDDSSVLLSSYEELLTYNEVKPVISEAVRMNWVYLIQFSDKNVPEKQEIELLIISNPDRDIIEDVDIPFLHLNTGEIRFLIQHTARSFGTDIESLLAHQVNSILIPSSKMKKFIRRNNSLIGILTALLFLVTSIIGAYINWKSYNYNKILNSNALVKSYGDNLSKKVDYILSLIIDPSSDFFYLKCELYGVLTLIISILLGVWIGILANNKRRSYIVTTREAKREMELSKGKSKRKSILLIFSLITSIISGVLSNYIFVWLIK
jgi:hypothetical protein